jgi:hypothetical protein
MPSYLPQRGNTYAHGSLSCQNNFEFTCSNGIWEGLNIAC